MRILCYAFSAGGLRRLSNALLQDLSGSGGSAVLEGIYPENAGCNAYSVRGEYRAVAGSVRSGEAEASPAVIAEFLQSNLADIRVAATEADSMLTVAAAFADAGGKIASKLNEMQALAERACTTLYTPDEKADFQKRLQVLAGEINQLAETASYNGNKLLTAEGQTISLGLADGNVTHLFARALTIDASGLDITARAEYAAAKLRAAVATAQEWSGEAKRQVTRLRQGLDVYDRQLNILDLNHEGLTSAVAFTMTKQIAADIKNTPAATDFHSASGERAALLLSSAEQR